MWLRLPFFGLVSQKSPMEGLLRHYEKISEGLKLIEESLGCYISAGGACREFQELVSEIDGLEDEADKIKRNIRNHMPRGLFMPVDKAIFLNYTRSQDNILDDAQDAFKWLVMRPIDVPNEHQRGMISLVSEVIETVTLLKPALTATISLVHGKHYDRQATKQAVRAVRGQHQKVWRLHSEVVSAIYNSDMDFKDIYQLIHFVERMNGMSHNTEGCADLLRAMIAR